MRLRNLKLAVRLGLGFGTLTLAILALGGLGLTSVQTLRGDLDELQERDLRGAVIAAELEVNAERVAHLTAQALYVYHVDPKKAEALSAQVKAIDEETNKSAAELEKLLAGTAGADDAKAYTAKEAEFDKAYYSALEASRRETAKGLLTEDARTGSRTLYREQVVPLATQLQKIAAQGRSAVDGSDLAGVEADKAKAAQEEREMVIVAVLALLVALVVATWITRSVTSGVRVLLGHVGEIVSTSTAELRRGMQALAKGDLTQEIHAPAPRIENPAGDEIGQLGARFNELAEATDESLQAYEDMRGALNGLLSDVSQSAELVAATAEEVAATSDEGGRAVGEIAAAITDVADGSERQLRMIESTRDAVDAAARTADESAANAGETAVAAEQARAVATDGVEAAQHATAAIEEIARTSAEVQTAIGALSARSEKIGGIVDTITALAEQTNLLALNAAIEAARAGEQGRGFAVVAEEVRKLAEESREAAGQISSLIEEMQGETGRVVSVVAGSTSRTEEGVATVARARDAFEAIGAAVEDVGLRVTMIAQAVSTISHEAQRASEDVVGVAAVAEESSASAEQVSASSQQSSASAQEIAASAQSLAGTAEHLNSLVAKFTLA